MNKKMRKVNSVLDEVEQYRMRMKRRRDFSFMSTPVEEQDGTFVLLIYILIIISKASPLAFMKKPDNIDAAVWQRFLAFEKFDRMKKQER